MTLLPASFDPQRSKPDASQEQAGERASVGGARPHKSENREGVARPQQTGGRFLGERVYVSRPFDLDDGPVWVRRQTVARRRLVLSRGQALAAFLVSFAALVIAASAAVHGAVAVHGWLCRTERINYCPPAPPTRPSLPR